MRKTNRIQFNARLPKPIVQWISKAASDRHLSQADLLIQLILSSADYRVSRDGAIGRKAAA